MPSSNDPDALKTNSLTSLQEYLNQVNTPSRIRDIPRLDEALLTRARNSVKRSANNNDLLEFIGDRVVNLHCAILVDKVKLSKAHHKTVRQVVCNNDMFGRLSFCLRFHQHAELEVNDKRDIEDWNPLSANHPPKVLADLFEAYIGAVFIQHGRKKVEQWLNGILQPMIMVATGDYWLSSSADQIFGSSSRSAYSQITVPETRTQSKLLDFIEFKRDFLTSRGRQALDALPESHQFRFDQRGRLEDPDAERVEVAIHLINMWICQLVVKLWPEYHSPTVRAAHMLSAITGLIISERVMASLGSLLSLSPSVSFTAPEAVPIDSKDNASPPSDRADLRNYQACKLTAAQRAITLKATVGLFHCRDPEGANVWGETWIRPVVLRAHDILSQENGYRPLVPRESQKDTLTVHAAALASLSHGKYDVSSLIDELGLLSIRSKAGSSAKQSPDGHYITTGLETRESSRRQAKPNAQNVSIGSRWRIVVHTKDSNQPEYNEDKSRKAADCSLADMSNLTSGLSSLSLAATNRAVSQNPGNCGEHDGSCGCKPDTLAKWRPIGVHLDEERKPIDVGLTSSAVLSTATGAAGSVCPSRTSLTAPAALPIALETIDELPTVQAAHPNALPTEIFPATPPSPHLSPKITGQAVQVDTSNSRRKAIEAVPTCRPAPASSLSSHGSVRTSSTMFLPRAVASKLRVPVKDSPV